MISFELSNGHPYGPHVPTSLDDDQYVEYPLDNLADFPCNMEKEERMFMEAVIESLKDLETRHPQVEEQPPSVGSEFIELSQNGDRNISATAEGPKTESISTPMSNGHSFASQQTSPDTSESSAGPALNATPSITESGSTGTSARSDVSVSVHSSSDADIVGNTKATLTFEKNPASHIMDGLMRRWDLNFFRNNR